MNKNNYNYAPPMSKLESNSAIKYINKSIISLFSLNLLRIKSSAYTYLLMAVLFLICTWVFQDYLQSSMALHMLLQIPLILFAGIFLSISISYSNLSKSTRYKIIATKLEKFNQLGISGFLFASLITMYWMIPKALDQVLISNYAQLSKYISVFVSGLVILKSYKAAHTVVRLFFIGGICWSMAIVGLLYQETDIRLCNFYLLNDQQWVGRGLVILAILLPTCWIISEVLQYRRIHPNKLN